MLPIFPFPVSETSRSSLTSLNKQGKFLTPKTAFIKQASGEVPSFLRGGIPQDFEKGPGDCKEGTCRGSSKSELLRAPKKIKILPQYCLTTKNRYTK